MIAAAAAPAASGCDEARAAGCLEPEEEAWIFPARTPRGGRAVLRPQHNAEALPDAQHAGAPSRSARRTVRVVRRMLESSP
ncbi:hypothetical protein WMF18_00810 [Sorangium sp. So ce315]|uniref:hypothetical protein n=1 Tax=Sorangium sp. So ce315 TaxID=3133299 RepID=UPI003F63735F